MKKIKGRYIDPNKETTTQGEWTVEEIAELVADNHFAMLVITNCEVVNKETGKKINMFTSGLTLYPNETIPREEGNKIVVPTYFKRGIFREDFAPGDSEELVEVDCLVDINSDFLYVSISKNN